jgi:hypothetical protein
LLATFIGWRADDEVLLAYARTCWRRPETVDMCCVPAGDTPSESTCGLAGAAAGSGLAAGSVDVDGQAARCVGHRMPQVNSIDAIAGDRADAAPPDLPALDIETWRRLEVRSAVPRITARTVEQFVPQMINLEIVGGVTQGCYPGGKSWRAASTAAASAHVPVECDVAAEPGQRSSQHDASQPAGMVVTLGPATWRHAAGPVKRP